MAVVVSLVVGPGGELFAGGVFCFSNSYWLYAGSSIGARDYYNSGQLGSVVCDTATGLPTDGTSAVYVRLWYQTGYDDWNHLDRSYIAAEQAGSGTPTLTSLPTGSQLDGAQQQISRADNGINVTSFWVYGGHQSVRITIMTAEPWAQCQR